MGPPADAADDRLRSNVHPPDWINPEPRGRYHLVVIGGGTAGLVSAIGAAGLGARVALVERALLGGDCLITGCVPSKAILRSARAAADARRADAVGVRVAGVEADFGAVMRRMRERRADISPHDSASRLRSAGVDVYFGEARFTSRSTIEVGGRTLPFRRAVIATGGHPAVPPIPGLSGVPYLTNETLFSLTDLPRRLGDRRRRPDRLRDGAGLRPARQRRDAGGSGAARAAAGGRRCGRPRRRPHGERGRDARIERHGCRRASRTARTSWFSIEQGGGRQELACDRLLVAAGRAPNVERPRSGGGRRGLRQDRRDRRRSPAHVESAASSPPATSARRSSSRTPPMRWRAS